MRSGGRPGREADLRYSAGRAQRGRGRSPPLLMALYVRSRGWRHHGRERGPFGFSRWGRGKAEARGSEKERARGLRDLRRRLFLLRRQAHPRMRKATITNNQTIPVVAGKG